MARSLDRAIFLVPVVNLGSSPFRHAHTLFSANQRQLRVSRSFIQRADKIVAKCLNPKLPDNQIKRIASSLKLILGAALQLPGHCS
jgi:hypothetical protein